ncbi:MAG TPA: DUF1003 domain-containing protein [Cytophagaceae bacterium]|jgi:uncharacterized membrane protein|nr:DUF1003 domain-containing protein [Cytophagaceae bacterium]
MTQNIPLKLEELKHRREVCLKELKGKNKVSKLGQLAIWITDRVGSMGFFFIIFFWTIIWLGWNILAPVAARFDPYPAFVLWLFISNMIQLFLLPLIMIGQNLQSQHAESRAETDLKINELAEIENETILMHLENQNILMLQILKNIESKTDSLDSKIKG